MQQAATPVQVQSQSCLQVLGRDEARNVRWAVEVEGVLQEADVACGLQVVPASDGRDTEIRGMGRPQESEAQVCPAPQNNQRPPIQAPHPVPGLARAGRLRAEPGSQQLRTQVGNTTLSESRIHFHPSWASPAGGTQGLLLVLSSCYFNLFERQRPRREICHP